MPADGGTPTAVARALVGSALSLRRGEHLVVSTWNHTLPWASALVAESRRIGARPLLLLEDEGAFWHSLDTAVSPRSWARLSSPARSALRHADAFLYFPGPADRPRLHALPPQLQSPFLGAEDEWLRRARATGLRAVRCLLGYASDAQAEHWAVPGALWRSQLVRGITQVDYGELKANGAKAARLLARGRELHLQAGNGTDVRFRLRGRTPWVDDGQVDAEDRRRGQVVATAPAGSVVVAVDEHSATGVAVSNRPSFLRPGRVEGAQWELEGGRLRNYWYTDGGEAFDEEFAAAPRGRETVGLVALGLNDALDRSVPQAEDQPAGTVTVAIGGNTHYGGRNRCRFLSWITVGEATVAVDGRPLVDRGKIL
ncbi:MAG TPA: aminopeptidase [Thermoplasmata archaeon]|nr:aminopeptidase [Thermoplasmata archaeon]